MATRAADICPQRTREPLGGCDVNVPEERTEMADSPEVAVITGASAGIGRATAREFARHGCKVALLARGRAGLETAAREVEELGGKALAIPTDVAGYEAVERAADRVIEEWGRI